MGAADRMRTVDDSTPLNGDVIDVAARIAWTVRMARLTAPEGIDNRLRSLAEAIGSSPAHLSRVETGQRRDGAVIDSYERALAMPPGSLRAPVEVLCRTFPLWCPRDLDPGEVVRDVAGLSALTARVEGPDPVSSGEWLRWATAMAQPGNVGFPQRQMHAAVTRLIGELGRTQGHAYPVRYEALARLRCSAYGSIVLEGVREHADRPYAAGLYDIVNAASECNTPDALEWFLELLESEDESLTVAGTLALENLSSITGEDFWPPVVPRVVAVFDSSSDDSVKASWCAHLLRLVPPSVLTSIETRPSRPLPPVVQVPQEARGPDNPAWVACLDAARQITDDLRLAPQPMLARLLYDIAFGHWETRAVTGYMLLDALPEISDRLGPAFSFLLAGIEDQGARDRLVRRVSYSLFAHDASLIGDWINSPDPSLRQAALVAAGPAQHHLPEDVLMGCAALPGFARSTLYSAGMSSHPVLATLATAEHLPERIRVAARWWSEQGGVLQD